MQCPNCKTVNDDSSQVCLKCGAQLNPTSQIYYSDAQDYKSTSPLPNLPNGKIKSNKIGIFIILIILILLGGIWFGFRNIPSATKTRTYTKTGPTSFSLNKYSPVMQQKKPSVSIPPDFPQAFIYPQSTVISVVNLTDMNQLQIGLDSPDPLSSIFEYYKNLLTNEGWNITVQIYEENKTNQLRAEKDATIIHMVSFIKTDTNSSFISLDYKSP